MSYSFEMQRTRRKGIMSAGYINPLMITENTLKLNERETLNHTIKYLDKHHDKACIEQPYNFG
jgi:hypothetical protein